jgi:hypothetical protein
LAGIFNPSVIERSLNKRQCDYTLDMRASDITDRKSKKAVSDLEI